MVAWAVTAIWQTHKPLPTGTHVEGARVRAAEGDIQFIADITSADAYGRPILSQAIFDEVLGLVRSARDFLVLDYFLFNDQRGAAVETAPARPLSAELRDALIERRRVDPQLPILLIVDPINELYGSAPSKDVALLRAAGVQVVTANLDVLRDSNFLYSSVWRLCFGWWGADGKGDGWLPNPLDEGAEEVTARAWGRLLNFKADHRKVILGGDGKGGLIGIVGSANPHDASSAHSNVALKVRGAALAPLLESEIAIARASGWKGEIRYAAAESTAPPQIPGATSIQALTEGAIRARLLVELDAASAGDSIDIAMFYIADRGVVESLLAAAQRGVAVRLILDPNKDAFGREKSGIPNRPVATELASASDGAIHVRWYRTHGEQFHTKLAMVYGPQRMWLTVGSANFTRRNLADYNLEANLAVDLPRDAPLAHQVREYFETLWTNRAPLGIEYTTDYGFYADPASSHYWLYRVMESTGLSTF